MVREQLRQAFSVAETLQNGLNVVAFLSEHGDPRFRVLLVGHVVPGVVAGHHHEGDEGHLPGLQGRQAPLHSLQVRVALHKSQNEGKAFLVKDHLHLGIGRIGPVVGAVSHEHHDSAVPAQGAVFPLQKLRRLPVVLKGGEERCAQ